MSDVRCQMSDVGCRMSRLRHGYGVAGRCPALAKPSSRNGYGVPRATRRRSQARRRGRQIGDQRFATANPSYGGSEVTGEES